MLSARKNEDGSPQAAGGVLLPRKHSGMTMPTSVSLKVHLNLNWTGASSHAQKNKICLEFKLQLYLN